MIVFTTTLLGGGFGALLARKRGGNRMDMLHYATILAIVGALLGLFITVFVSRGM